MALPNVAMYSQADKASLGQSYDNFNTDFFDQFLTFDPADNEARNVSPELLGSSDPSISPEIGTDIDQELWRDGSWAQIPGALHFHFYSEASGRAAISDSELLSLESITLDSPQPQLYPQFHSLPTSPTNDDTALPSKTTRIVNSLSKKLKKSSSFIENTLRSPIRKSTSSPKAMRSKSISMSQKLDTSKFDFDFEVLSRPISPATPTPTTPKKAKKSSAQFDQENDSMELSPADCTKPQHTSAAFETPFSTPLLDSQSSQRATLQRSHSMFQPVTPQQEQHSNGWTHMPISPEYSNFGSADGTIWYNNASTAPMAQPSPTALHLNPQRATKSLALQLQNGISYNNNERGFIPPIPHGLMIPNTQAEQSFVVQSSPSSHRPRQHYYPSSQPQSHAYASYHRRLHPHQRSKSYHHGDRRQKLPQPSSSESPSPKSFHARKHRKMSARGSKSSTPRTPQIDSGGADFVNYTPDDSKKILTGVAPSGSSKTKARREREAMEKRRKLSQAAVRAVRAAGGDVESLVEQGLLC